MKVFHWFSTVALVSPRFQGLGDQALGLSLFFTRFWSREVENLCFSTNFGKVPSNATHERSIMCIQFKKIYRIIESFRSNKIPYKINNKLGGISIPRTEEPATTPTENLGE